eukprot:5977637-Ditylum_brightwellii.AAC.1
MPEVHCTTDTSAYKSVIDFDKGMDDDFIMKMVKKIVLSVLLKADVEEEMQNGQEEDVEVDTLNCAGSLM